MSISIQPPAAHHLLAAIGWMELGDPEEALKELECLGHEFENHPDVLEVWWSVLAQKQDWTAAFHKARTLHRISPDRPGAWIHLAYSLRRVQEGGLPAAWEVLLPAHERFPKEPLVAFNLACYACQMKRPREALEWLHIAAKIGDPRVIKAMALQDSDLESLREEIQQL